ncbi:MAG: hypothetical protein AAF632_26135 [Bacteroidota bacterium]
MINDDDKFDIIERYLGGILDEETTREVEQRMDNDEAFRKEVLLQEGISKFLDNNDPDYREMKEDLDRIAEEREISTSRRTSQPEVSKPNGTMPIIQFISQHRFALAAAVSLILVAVVLFLLNPFQEPTSQLAYVEVLFPEGAMGSEPASVPDSIAIMIISDDDQYNFHYSLGDTLKLYGDFNADSLSILYRPNAQDYFLQRNGKEYLLVSDKMIRTLEVY